jgi:hypothetical protein
MISVIGIQESELRLSWLYDLPVLDIVQLLAQVYSKDTLMNGIYLGY